MAEHPFKVDTVTLNLRPPAAARDNSSRSVLSNASGSSTKTHRRLAVEISSILFTGPEGSYPFNASELIDAYTTKPVHAVKSRQENSSVNQGFDRQNVSIAFSISMQISSDDNMVGSTTNSEIKDGQGTKHTRDAAFCAAELIRELSFSCLPKRSSSTVTPDGRSYHDGTDRPQLDALGAEENDLPPSTPPPLPPMIRRLELDNIIDIPSNRNRTRSTSISEMSDSYFNERWGEEDVEKSATSVMHKPSGNHVEHEANAPLGSYVSSLLSDDIIIENIVEFDMEDHANGDIFSVQKSRGLSSKGGRSNSRGDDTILRKQVLLEPRLTPESLKEWDMLCEEHYPKRDVSSIFRARSCPVKVPAATLPYQGGCDVDLQDGDQSESGIRHMISQSMFSYTNSGSSSTTSSNDDVRSDLDFDVGLFAPIHIPDPVQFSPKRRSV